MHQTSALHSVRSKLALTHKANFFVYILAFLCGFLKRVFSARTKTETLKQNLELPYIKNEPAFWDSFIVSEPVLIREYTLVRTEGKLVAFDQVQKVTNPAIPSKKHHPL